MKEKIVKFLITRLLVIIVVLGEVGWFMLFGRYLPPLITMDVVYGIIIASAVISVFLSWKKEHLLRSKIFAIGLIIFVLVGLIGWIASY
jgi:hypothetical protein